jgi:NADH-quinone oxidoreductase subunit J
MSVVFYLAGATAVLATALALTRLQPVHALLYLVVSLLAVAVVFFSLGAPFVAALEIIVYAGAIMVFFVFVIMMLNLGDRAVRAERDLLPARAWFGPSGLAALLLALFIYIVSRGESAQTRSGAGPTEVSRSLFGPYALGVELASMLLTAALVGAYHLGVQERSEQGGTHGVDSREPYPGPGGDPVRAGTRRIDGAP